MVEKQQDKATEAKDVSPLVRDKTYGERVYNSVFNKGLNFWVNLMTSAAFSLYAANSRSSIKLWGMKEASTPHGIQQSLAGKIDKYLLKPFIKDDAVRAKRSFAVAEVQTLLLPGHIIMIPSVWLGAKIKPAFVRYFDKKHYGANAEDDPSISYRHQMIDAEAKPTLLGAVVGRFGTMMSTTLASSLIGSKDNFVNKLGDKHDIGALKSFAVNPVAKQIGEVVGGGATREVGALSKVNDRVSKHLMWSKDQINTAAKGGVDLTKRPYDQAVQDYSGFVAMDTLYTLITASVIHPIMAVLRRVPGMTYTTAEKPDTVTTTTGELKVRVPKNRMAITPAFAEEAAPKAPMVEGQPQINVSEIKHLERINNHQKEVNAI